MAGGKSSLHFLLTENLRSYHFAIDVGLLFPMFSSNLCGISCILHKIHSLLKKWLRRRAMVVTESYFKNGTAMEAVPPSSAPSPTTRRTSERCPRRSRPCWRHFHAQKMCIPGWLSPLFGVAPKTLDALFLCKEPIKVEILTLGGGKRANSYDRPKRSVPTQ